jgi:hypothetical protein
VEGERALRTTVPSIMMFYILLNICLFLLNALAVLPASSRIEPMDDPLSITGKLAHISGTDIAIGVVTISLGFIVGWLLKRIFLGGTIGVILFALDLLSPVAGWILYGFPRFLEMIGVNSFLVLGLQAILAVPWFWFFIELFSQREFDKG